MSFDRLADHYDWMEQLLAGGLMQKCRTAFLDEARGARSILLAGEGHGRFLPALRRANPEASITCVDASERMLAAAKRRLRRAGVETAGIDFRSLRIQEFESAGTFDLVVTHFFLDCFDSNELALVIRNLSGALRLGGRWIVADFQTPAQGWRRQRARAVLALAYGFFRCFTGISARALIDPAPRLRQCGMSSRARMTFNFDLLYAELWEKKSEAAS